MGEVDIGFVIHGDEAGGLGPAARFALDASPGDRLGFRGQGIAIIEVPTAGDRQEFRVSLGMEARWVTRDESHAGTDRPGQLALDALKATVPLDGVVHARLIGESGLAVTSCRNGACPDGTSTLSGFGVTGDLRRSDRALLRPAEQLELTIPRAPIWSGGTRGTMLSHRPEMLGGGEF